MYTVNELEINYLALALCILTPKMITVEKAFAYFDRQEYIKLEDIEVRMYLDQDDTLDMIKLAEEMSYREIGELYGLGYLQTYRRATNYRAKLRRKGNVS